jgi:BirA family transcriptional regulator, biotin operon repressor / biotin---[acetyl-CoA-carboxylase] ligase
MQPPQPPKPCFDVTSIPAQHFETSQLVEALAGAGHKALHFSALDSTMSEASRQATAGHQGTLWIIADSQDSGRGRHGRNWVSPPGNLHATLLLTSGVAAANAAEIGFVAGLALHDAVCVLTGLKSPRLALKWPNDLLIDHAKCAGLLLEGTSQGSAFTLAVGFGVNVSAAPEGFAYAATALGQHVPEASREQLMLLLANSFAERFAMWHKARETGAGFADVREEWRRRAAFLGKQVVLRLPAGPVSGIFDDVDATGRLVLVTSDGRRIIDAGDLFFGDAPA